MAQEKDITETQISSEVIASGGMLTVHRDQVQLANGHQSQREYVLHPGAVVVVPVLNNGNVILEKQFRYPLRQAFIELPAGKIDPGEALLTTGQRELLEETGYTAAHWVKLGLQHPCIGYSDEVIHMYLAYGLTAGESQQDIDESLEVFEMPFQRAVAQVYQGKITDAKTIVALMFAQEYLTQNPVDTLTI